MEMRNKKNMERGKVTRGKEREGSKRMIVEQESGVKNIMTKNMRIWDVS